MPRKIAPVSEPMPPEIHEKFCSRFVLLSSRGLPWFDIERGEMVTTKAVISWIEHEFNLNFCELPAFANTTFYSSYEDKLESIYLRRYKRDRGGVDGIRLAHAPQYAPNKPLIFPENGKLWVNKWRGWGEKRGDISPFLQLISEAIMAPDDEVSFMLNTIAARMQTTGHIPYCIMLVGDPQTGNLILDCLAAAFGRHTTYLSHTNIRMMKKNWIDRSSLCIIRDGRKFLTNMNDATYLSNLVMTEELASSATDGDKKQEKFQIPVDKNKCLFVISAEPTTYFNQTHYAKFGMASAACAFQVIRPREDLLREVSDWVRQPKSGPALAYYFVNRELNGFQTPAWPPNTQFMNHLRKQAEAPFVTAVKEASNGPENPCAVWISRSLEWADGVMASVLSTQADKELAESIRLFMPELKIAPFYTAAEISMMFPETKADLISANRLPEGRKKHRKVYLHEGIGQDLQLAGIPILVSRDSQGFLHRGKYETFFVIHDRDRWRKPMSQEEFEAAYASFGTYRDYVAMGGKYGKAEKPVKLVDPTKQLWWRQRAKAW